MRTSARSVSRPARRATVKRGDGARRFRLAKARAQTWNPRVAFTDFPARQQGVALLQRSLERGRLAHAYLFTGDELEELEGLARTLAKTLNCEAPRRVAGAAVDCCETVEPAPGFTKSAWSPIAV